MTGLLNAVAGAPLTGAVRSCFDGARAAGPTRVVAVTAVVDLLEITHAADRILEYQEAMRQGARFPPVAVVRCGRRFWLADGHKRFAAYRALGEREILVEVWSWGRVGRDQWRQFRHKTAQQWRVVRGARRDAAGRAAFRRLLGDTIGHWRRIALSWQRRLARRRGAD